MTQSSGSSHTHTWILAANAARAVVMDTETARKMRRWHLVETLVHPESREHGMDLGTDRPGVMLMSASSGRRSALEHTPIKETEARHFAAEVATYLDRAHTEGRYGRLVLSAGPHFLGMLREHLSPAVTGALQATVDRDYTHLDPEQLHAQLVEFVGV